MNKSFTVIDKSNNVQKNANTIVKFNFENKDYIVYSIEENEQNRQIFVSKLILNSEGKYFIENILPEEKGKLNTIVYNIVILTPTEAKKGTDALSLISGLTEKFAVNLSTEIPDLIEQEYFSNCSIAITSKILVEEAVKFYEEHLTSNGSTEQADVLTPTWTLPIENDASVTPANETPSIEGVVITQTAEPVVQNVPVTPVSTNGPVVSPIAPNSEPQGAVPEGVLPNLNNSQNIIPTEVTPNITTPQNTVITQSPINNGGTEVQTPPVNNTPIENIPNPQAEKLGGNVAIVSDPSLESAGIGVQPNIGKMKKAGFAINKYIIIGTVCLLLAVAVVIVAYILIQKKTTGV